MIREHNIQYQQDVYACFIDYKKAFDNVRHAKHFEILETIHIDNKDECILEDI